MYWFDNLRELFNGNNNSVTYPTLTPVLLVERVVVMVVIVVVVVLL